MRATTITTTIGEQQSWMDCPDQWLPFVASERIESALYADQDKGLLAVAAILDVDVDDAERELYGLTQDDDADEILIRAFAALGIEATPGPRGPTGGDTHYCWDSTTNVGYPSHEFISGRCTRCGHDELGEDEDLPIRWELSW